VRAIGYLFILCCLLLCKVGHASIVFGNNDDYKLGAPRFTKDEKGTFYVGINVGFNVIDNVSPFVSLGFADRVNTALSSIYSNNIPTAIQPTGYPILSIGYLPISMPYIRHQIEVSIKTLTMNFASVTPTNQLSLSSTEKYSTAYALISVVRVIYELFLQYKIPNTPIIAFVGGGVGININNSFMSTSSGTTAVTTSTTSTTNFAQSQVVIGLAYQASGGVIVAITQGFAVELKVRYAFGNGAFGGYYAGQLINQAIEISAGILLKI
jgi:hypothetical protein